MPVNAGKEQLLQMGRRRKDEHTLPLFGASPVPVALADRKQIRDVRAVTDKRLEPAKPVHELDDIAARARELMAALGLRLRGQTLQGTGWRFEFDRARTRLGCCSYTPGRRGRSERKVISISRPFATAYGWALMEDVVRHEVAHALDVDTRFRTDHGPHWKAWAERCGADPTRLYEGEDVQLPAKYVAICPSCGDRSGYHRRPRRPGACASCCKQHSGGRYDPRFRLVFYPAELAPARQLPLFSA